MARRAFWPTVETSEVTIFARGILAPAACGPAPTDCCGTDAPGSTTCCPDGFDETILFAAFGPIGTDFTTELLEYELNWNTERNSWIGGAEGAEGIAIALELWCEEDDEFGTVWWLAGSYFAVELGVRIPFLIPSIVPANGLIVAEIEVLGTTKPLTVVVAHPCSDLEPGGGEAPGSGSDPGGAINLCGCTNVSTPLYVTFYGALASYGTKALTYVDSFIGWTVTPADGPCNTGNSPIAFNCQSGSTWILSSPGSGNPVSTSFSDTATAISCSPLMVAFGGTATGTCGGAWTAVVTEYDPSSVPPAGPSDPGQPSYCLTAPTIPGGLTLAPKTASSWWSDHAGSWILTQVSSLGWRLTNPRGDVFFSGSWNGTGSHTFEGIYTVTAGACA